MKKLVLLTAALILVSGAAFATWEDAASWGIVPFWQADDAWYTLLIFVNGSEDDYDTVYVRFCDVHGNYCSDLHADMFGLRPGEHIMICTRLGIGYGMLISAGSGYLKYRLENGAPVHAYALIYNQVTQTGCTVPAFNQKDGF